ncbi:ZIP family metal transporter [Natrialbaceae archaeon AArc-T1-2]|uniref:ZIP family metal transporter n=1 Tax=Natrialbaceae archaeon AArc-T1-2 TaxID=3053904 RepID=UPI00255B3851|nr:metal cation transporter [Natrialbaceae archaeon AArc-T1-2]WIV66224.1 metal cation transporter [Natrialbaceae archaeon AArc-T1-2]
MTSRSLYELPRWMLAIGPVVILLAVFGVLYLTSPFGDLASVEDASMLEIVWMLTVIGAIAGIVPVAIGMLWFPFIRELDTRYLHAFLALAAGVLAFIAVEMTEDMIFDYGVEVEHTMMAVAAAALGIGGTFAVMYAVSRWRQRTMASAEKSGLEIAYLVALALGLHSIGEGLGIGVAYIQGDATLLTLLVLAFVMHNVMEGPTVVAAVARERTTPPLRHFAAMGVIAGGPVILGGWIGSFAQSNLLAVLFFAIAIGAILQVLIEVAELIRFDAEAALTRTTTATFALGFVLMFLLEDVFTDVVLEGLLIG